MTPKQKNRLRRASHRGWPQMVYMLRDMRKGRMSKVHDRFRIPACPDDVLDFSVFLSPGAQEDNK